ncbi:MAG: radical SAM protein [Planctomycetota bacterium]
MDAHDAFEPCDDWADPWEGEHGDDLCERPPVRPRVLLERARSVVTSNASPDIPFDHAVNPYRGCAHACIYCYARPTHEYLELDADAEFESVLFVKSNAPEVLAKELTAPRLAGRVVCFSGVTDPYQPLEASFGITRRLLEVCAVRRQPVLVFTKGALVRRDADVLARIARTSGAMVYLSIPFADPEVARALEPAAPSPSARFRAMRALADAGVPVGLSLAPLVPGLNDRDVARLVECAAESGATRAFTTFLRLPGPVEEIFARRLAERLPDAAKRVESALRDAGAHRAGRAAFGERMVGSGPRWELAVDLFRKAARRCGIEANDAPEPVLPRVTKEQQGELFG